MKLRSRLIISFCIIIFVPIILFILLASGMRQVAIAMEPDTALLRYIAETMSFQLEEYKALVINFCVSAFIILIFTAIILVIWIYGGIVPRLNELRKSANRIKEGNLDFTVKDDGNDEISELFDAFEDMRARLQRNALEKLETEAEQRAMISNIAHDLKTPITAIKGYSEGILDGVADTPQKQEKYIRTIYNKANEMNNLINELTLFAKIDTNKIPYNFQKLNVDAYFSDCVSDLSMDLENQYVRLEYTNYVAKDVLFIGDPEQLGRVINNIISNSVKYMRADVEARISFVIKDVGDFVQIEIRDNGKGINAGDLPHIFDRFYRADASRNSAAGGSGIGLSIVRKIIDDHGGKIWATSIEGEGTTMYFVLRKYQEVINE